MFRLRDTKYHTWIEEFSLYIENNEIKAILTRYGIDPCAIREKKNPDGTFGNGLVLMEGIGQRDINKKDIFEKDVIRFKYRASAGNHCGETREEIIVVEKTTGGWYPFNMFNFNGFKSEENVEVIGNVYDNPELEKRND